MAIHKTQAIVLKTTKFRETSYIVTFFSRDFGKFQALIKAVRQPGSPWAGLFEPMNLIEVVFYEKLRSDIHLATEASGIDLRREIRKDFRTLAYGYYLTEVLESFSNPGEADEDYWNLITETYAHLPQNPPFISLIFQLKLLTRSGFFPNLNTLSLERGENELETYFSSYLAEMLKRPDTKSFLALAQNKQMIQCFKYLLKEDWQNVFRLEMNPHLMEEAENLMAWLVSAKLDRKLRSRKFLEGLAVR